SPGIDPEVRDFFTYHACLVEPWDGPAGLVFADGRRVGASLDRNGLRPLRVHVCDDGLIAVASEAGAVPVRGHGRVQRLKLGPGESLCVDPAAGGLLLDQAVKARLARARPYGDWLAEHSLEMHFGDPVEDAADDVTARQVAAGYTKEEITVVLRPMAIEGHEPTSSMGDDTAQPPLARYPRGVFSYLKQRFAQVTNPPIDHLRERYVMSIATRLGRRAPLLAERPEAAALRHCASFFLFPSAVDDLVAAGAAQLDATFDLGEGPEGLARACAELGRTAIAAVRTDADVLVVSHAAVGPDRVPVPSPLAVGAIHTALVQEGLRSRAGLVADVDDARDSHHAAVLLTVGADALCPRLALVSIAALAGRGRLGGGVSNEDAQTNFKSALEDGVMKIMSKMGISTLDSYRGAQIVEAMGLRDDVVQACFPGVASVLGGLSFDELGADAIVRHDAAFGTKPVLANPGSIKHKAGGEYHAFNPDVIDSLHAVVGLAGDNPTGTSDPEMAAAHELRKAVRGDDDAYARFAALVNERPPTEPRDLLELVVATEPVPLDEVEPASAIARRFSTGAMSHGALSAEAHETLSIALNMIGGMANTGEGGEAPERYGDQRNSGIKQIASGRFGVTPAYLANARELQIKMAQGSKPGEGGQLPGHKVSAEIARIRHTTPGVTLISPPPHHDIYSIEDLAQLIYDLKQINPQAVVSVKLVAQAGVGTIAAGVAKAGADIILISGDSGGTGASPLMSIKHAGLPWEL
ncbi:MAG: glutamate synthase-related protein, partial [Actinomycetota bacterium]|nr:glutamate synthase-related protein [Actinomycetota bacterium]